MAEQRLKIDPPITQVIEGVSVGYEVVLTTKNNDLRKKSISDVRVYPIDENGSRLKGAKQLYRNGVWSKSQITTLTDEQQGDFHKRIQRQTIKFAQNTNATSPQWARIIGSDTKSPPDADTSPEGLASGILASLGDTSSFVNNIIGGATDLTNIVKTIQDEGLFGLMDEVSSNSGSFDQNSDTAILQNYNGYLRYPQNMNPNQDSLKMTCFRYRSPYRDAIQETSIGNVKRNSPFRERLGTIELPMPVDILDSTSAGWEVDYMNDITMAAAQSIQKNALGYAGAAVGGMLPGMVGKTIGAASKIALIGSLAAGASKNQGISGLVGANVLSMLGSNLGFDIPADQILSRGGGIVSNSNAELMFRGVKLRQFQFNYNLIARSVQETQGITYLIRAFKQWSAPRKLSGDVSLGPTQAGGSSLFLGTPNIFQLSYMTTESGNRVVNRYVHKFKPCALTAFSVNYAPNSQWLSYENGAPVTFNLNFTFSELEPIYNTDFTTNISSDRRADPLNGTGTGDLMPIQVYDVGY